LCLWTLVIPEWKGQGTTELGGGSETMNDDKPDRPGQMQTDLNQRNKAKGRLGRDVQSKIGQQLRSMYDNVVSEGVPDRFTDMLRQLDEQTAQQAKAQPDQKDKEVN
jgi:hypothetical protein